MHSFVLPEFDPAAIPIEQIPVALAALAAWRAALAARLLITPGRIAEIVPETDDRLLTVRECADRLRKSPKWVYGATRHSRSLDASDPVPGFFAKRS
jgi:hypothetical protein